MKTPIWVLEQVVYAIHEEQLAEHGGLAGIRDPGLLTSALEAPINIFNYEKASLFTLAAAYAYRISNNQPFVDGNKRTGYVVSRLFLLLNGYDINATEIDRVKMFLDISSNVKSETNLASWFEKWAVELSNQE